MQTKEGQAMYNRLTNKPIMVNTSYTGKKNILQKVHRPLSELQVEFFITELTDLLNKSKKVVEDCNTILSLCTTQDEYLKNDAKVAKMIHSRLIDKYTNLLEYKSLIEKKQ